MYVTLGVFTIEGAFTTPSGTQMVNVDGAIVFPQTNPNDPIPGIWITISPETDANGFLQKMALLGVQNATLQNVGTEGYNTVFAPGFGSYQVSGVWTNPANGLNYNFQENVGTAIYEGTVKSTEDPNWGPFPVIRVITEAPDDGSGNLGTCGLFWSATNS